MLEKDWMEILPNRQAERIAHKEVWEQNAKANAECIAQLDLILDKEKAQNLKGLALKDQLKLFKMQVLQICRRKLYQLKQILCTKYL